MSGSPVASFDLTPSRCSSSRKSRSTGWGNLGRRGLLGLKPNPPCSGSNCSASCSRPSAAGVSRQRQLALAARGLEPLADGLGHGVGRLLDLGLLLRPGLGHGVDDRQEARRSLAIARREIRPAEERAAVGRQEQRHRPAPGPERLKRGHVDLVDVGPLLAVDLDAHEARVQCPGDLRIDEALALHDVAPVARAIADRQKDRLVLGLGLGERLGPPGIPVDRVVGVEEQVRARLLGQPVGRPVLARGYVIGRANRPRRR